MPVTIGKLKRLARFKYPYIEKNLSSLVNTMAEQFFFCVRLVGQNGFGTAYVQVLFQCIRKVKFPYTK